MSRPPPGTLERKFSDVRLVGLFAVALRIHGVPSAWARISGRPAAIASTAVHLRQLAVFRQQG